MLEKLPGVASADADTTTSSATVVYDKSVFDVSALGDEGRYKFELREDSAAKGDASDEDESNSKGDVEKEDQDSDSSKIQIQDIPAGGESASGDQGDSDIMPSLDGPAS